MDIGRAFGFIREDEEWVKKILIGGLILIVPILDILFIYGYMTQIARNVYLRHPRPLPDFSDFGELLKKGLYVVVIALVYSIPILIVQCISQVIVSFGASGNDGTSAMGLLALCLVPLSIIVGLLVTVSLYAAWVRYIQTDTLSNAFQFNEVVEMIRQKPSLWAMLIVMSILASLFGALGAIACGIGIFFTVFFGQAAMAHALGQAAIQMETGNGNGGADFGNIPPTTGSYFRK